MSERKKPCARRVARVPLSSQEMEMVEMSFPGLNEMLGQLGFRLLRLRRLRMTTRGTAGFRVTWRLEKGPVRREVSLLTRVRVNLG